MTNTFLEWDSYDSTRITQLIVNRKAGGKPSAVKPMGLCLEHSLGYGASG